MSFWDKKKHFRDVVGLDFSPINAQAYLGAWTSVQQTRKRICLMIWSVAPFVGLKSQPLGFFCNSIWGLDFSPTNAKAYLLYEDKFSFPSCGTEVPSPFASPSLRGLDFSPTF